MTISLSSEEFPARTLKHGADRFAQVAGEKLRVQTWDAVNGIVDVLSEVTVPTGKAWDVVVTVNITETDA